MIYFKEVKSSLFLFRNALNDFLSLKELICVLGFRTDEGRKEEGKNTSEGNFGFGWKNKKEAEDNDQDEE